MFDLVMNARLWAAKDNEILVNFYPHQILRLILLLILS